jgi:glutathione S-transferase
MVLRKLKRTILGQGSGRHTRAEVEDLARRDIAALAVTLGDKPFLLGPEPCGADATVASFVMGSLSKTFITPIRSAAEAHPNLVAYRRRMTQLYFPELAG